jgi:hypothetical protein
MVAIKRLCCNIYDSLYLIIACVAKKLYVLQRKNKTLKKGCTYRNTYYIIAIQDFKKRYNFLKKLPLAPGIDPETGSSRGNLLATAPGTCLCLCWTPVQINIYLAIENISHIYVIKSHGLFLIVRHRVPLLRRPPHGLFLIVRQDRVPLLRRPPRCPSLLPVGASLPLRAVCTVVP